jgi:transcriptional regulator with XRE-family HTH domain
MIIGERLRLLREHKKLSQGDIEKRTGLLRCYISRVEKGHTVPALETLEKLARALDLSLYQLLYDGDEPPRAEVPGSRKGSRDSGWGSSGKELRFMRKLRHLLGKMHEEDRELLLFTVQQMARKKKHAAQAEPQAAEQEAHPEPKEAAAAATASD